MRQVILTTMAAGAVAMASGGMAAAETELSFYLGSQTSPHSRVSGDYPGGMGSYDALIGWEGRSFDSPPYYGLRGTWWQPSNIGYGLEFTHAKIYAPNDEKRAIGFSDLEFTDGLNILTVNVSKRWPDQWGQISPYVGGGVGIAVPHVDVDHPASGSETFGYQVTGPAMRLTAGASYPISDRVSIFGEYQFTFSQNEAELDGGGTLTTQGKTNALNLGLSLNF